MSLKNNDYNTIGRNVCGQRSWTKYKLITSAGWLLCTRMFKCPANIQIKALYWSEDSFFSVLLFFTTEWLEAQFLFFCGGFLAHPLWIWKTHFTKQLDRFHHKSRYYLLVPRALNSAVAQLPPGLSKSAAQLQPAAFTAAKVSICILPSATCGGPPLKRSQRAR